MYVRMHALVREQVPLCYMEVEVHDESLVSVIIRCRGLGGGEGNEIRITNRSR